MHRLLTHGGRLAAALVLCLALLPGTAWTGADKGTSLQPDKTHPETARLIAKLLTYQHFRKLPIDDALSSTVLDSFIRGLDPERYYFTTGDIEQFNQYRNILDDMLMEGDLSAPYAMHARFQQRARERSAFALELIDGELDFDNEMSLELDRRKADWAEDEDAQDLLWRKRVKNDALTMMLSGETDEQTFSLLRTRYKNMASNMAKSSPEEVFEMFMGAWSRGFDPHTAYMSPRNSREFDIQMKLSLEGIGAMLRTESELTEIVELVPGGPADKDGQLKPGDRIIGVAQGDGEMVDVVGWRLSEVVDLIRGPRESEVRLRIMPSAGSDAGTKTVTLVRNEIKLEEQAAQSTIHETERDGETHRVGVIKIPAFYADFAAAQAGDENYRSTTRDVRKLLLEMADKDVHGLVIDLRGNSGGSLQEAADLTGLFIPSGPIVQIKRNNGETEIMRDRDSSIDYSGPLAVMVDRFSASASEIFAGAIQDYGRGVILGEQTFGKGTVQTLVDLNRFTNNPDDEAGRLKLTIAKFYRITGSSTQKRGITPDIEFPSVAYNQDVGESAADNPLPWDSIKGTSFRPFSNLEDTLSLIRHRHNERSASSEAFQAMVADLEKQTKLNNRTMVSLNSTVRKAERDNTNAERLERANRRRVAHGLEPIEDLDKIGRSEDVPDTLLDSTVEIVTDLFMLRTSPAVAKRWEAARASR